MKKKLIAVILTGVLSLSVSLAGCSTSTDTSKVADKGKDTNPLYPTKQIEIVVPFAAGGSTDLVQRATADYLTKEWGQPVVVVNKVGGGGVVGSQDVLKQSAHDGYSVLALASTNGTMLTAGMVNPPIKFEEYKYGTRLVTGSIGFAVKDDAPWKDMKEFIEWAKKNPDQLTWAATGPSSISSFAFAGFMQSIGADYTKTRLIPVTGGADAAIKVAGGNALFTVYPLTDMLPMFKAGKIRLLAVQSTKRDPVFPDVPTLEELGIKGATIEYWIGNAFPVGTPDYVIKKWEEATKKMMDDPTFVDKMKNLNLTPAHMNSVDFNKFAKDEYVRFTDVATKVGIRK
jgi:tripartite-type tricarboxylate transporter receptor subunit TctC